MRLKSLEIKGFKSFANQTVINFNEDVIGVVGPNGSGKSNIVDAIRWVLGEQKSKELRLDKMTSVIFNGTSKRKKSSQASVYLTFTNDKGLLPSEYGEVSIGRVLYATGESEYRLNGVACRLKDVRSLFLDTGIGSNSYAIIALGMVDDILSDKNNARRKMFEQAAGISKYKQRKHETLNKLNATTEDLDRIEDLLFEIDNNLKELEKQARRAKRFYELKEKYKVSSIELAKIQLGSFKGEHQNITQDLTKHEDEYRQCETDVLELEQKLEQVRKDHLDQEKALSQKQKVLNELVGELRTLEGNKNMFHQRIEFIDENKVRLTDQIANTKVRIAELSEELATYNTNLTNSIETETHLSGQMDFAQAELDEISVNHNSLKEKLDEIMKDQQQLEKEVYELEKQKAVNQSQIQNYNLVLEKSNADISTRESAIAEVVSRLATVNIDHDNKQARVDELLRSETDRKIKLEEKEGHQERLRAEIAETNRKLDAKQNEYKLTKSMIDNLEGFPESIKYLNNNRDWNANANLLSDVIYCKEENRVAVESFLEPYLNYYVVDNHQDAIRAIELLGSNQKGKANFFILDAIKEQNYYASQVPGTKRALDVVESDPKYRKLVNHLLRGVLVTNTDDINSINLKDHMVLLSPNGKFIKGKYTLSGGSIGLFEGKKIGRKKNLEILTVEIKELEVTNERLANEMHQVTKELDELKSQISEQELEAERMQLAELVSLKVSMSTKIDNFKTFLYESTEKKTDAEGQTMMLKETNSEIDAKLIEKNNLAETARTSISDTDESFKMIASKLSDALANHNQAKINFIQQQSQVQTYKQELQFKENRLKEFTDQMTSNEQELKDSDLELEKIKVDVSELEQKLVEQYRIKEEEQKALTEDEQRYFSERQTIGDTEEALKQANKKMMAKQQFITELKDNFNELKLNLTSIGERLKIEFNLTLEEVMEGEPANADIDIMALNTQVEKWKKRLDNYGEVNPMAMEAYDEMKERHDTITGQRDDILQAKADLLETIKEIESTATEHFLKAFNQVRADFKEVFKTLFTQNDDCDIFLVDETNPLESQIDITAKPKGKRPQSINQLSGGEKTLTATALLFSLYLLKPAPFCIFDEVDAPLDDANIDKFCNIIRKFSTRSQFIIVTHNKQTMSAVDIIYGVYMAEQGVSNVSAVDFRQLSHNATLETLADGGQ